MAGNSLRSGVLLALDAGCQAVLIRYPRVWAHGAALAPAGHPGNRQCDWLGGMAAGLAALPSA